MPAARRVRRRCPIWGASPYRAIGIYIGGANAACSQPNLSATWVSQESVAGWHMVPIYVGLQSPSNSCGCAGISPASASAQGTAAAQDAVVDAQAIGMGGGNPIYFDMEAYNRTSTNTAAVLAFLAGVDHRASCQRLPVGRLLQRRVGHR